jgi:hypothetical protein
MKPFCRFSDASAIFHQTGKRKPAAWLVLRGMGEVVISANKASNAPIFLKDGQHRTNLIGTLWKSGEKRLLNCL